MLMASFPAMITVMRASRLDCDGTRTVASMGLERRLAATNANGDNDIILSTLHSKNVPDPIGSKG